MRSCIWTQSSASLTLFCIILTWQSRQRGSDSRRAPPAAPPPSPVTVWWAAGGRRPSAATTDSSSTPASSPQDSLRLQSGCRPSQTWTAGRHWSAAPGSRFPGNNIIRCESHVRRHRCWSQVNTHRRSELQQVLDPAQDVLNKRVHVFTVNKKHISRDDGKVSHSVTTVVNVQTGLTAGFWWIWRRGRPLCCGPLGCCVSVLFGPETPSDSEHNTRQLQTYPVAHSSWKPSTTFSRSPERLGCAEAPRWRIYRIEQRFRRTPETLRCAGSCWRRRTPAGDSNKTSQLKTTVCSQRLREEAETDRPHHVLQGARLRHVSREMSAVRRRQGFTQHVQQPDGHLHLHELSRLPVPEKTGRTWQKWTLLHTNTLRLCWCHNFTCHF